MIVSVRPIILGVSLAVLVFTAPSHAAAQQSAPPAPPAGSSQGQAGQGQSSSLPNSDYGSGGHAVVQKETAEDVLSGTVDANPRGQAVQPPKTSEDTISGTVIYDPSGAPRCKQTSIFSHIGGVEQKTEVSMILLDSKGHRTAYSDLKYDLRGGLSYSDVTHYGLHGERTAEEVTNYRTDGYEIKDWSLGTHQWYSNNITYKTPLPTGTPAQAPLTPTSTNIGVLFPRSYLPGETITGSLWPSTYAENFKAVPGLSESSFPIQLYLLPDGSPEWSSIQIGVKGDGYFPVNPNGTFSLHIPYDWKGPLQLQARQPNPVAGLGPTDAQLNLDPPAAAPTIPSNQFSNTAQNLLDDYTRNHLVDLWGDACDLEETLNALYDEQDPDWARIYAVEDDLDDVYDKIDDIEDDMSPQDVISLAQQMEQEAEDFHDWLNKQPNLTADDKDDLADSASWADFLDNEIGYNKFEAGWGPTERIEQPYWTNPVMPQGKLDVIHGSFPLDPYDTHLHIDNSYITPLAATTNSWYFMPPTGLTAGLHDLYIDSPLFPETIFPVFSMTLYMTAANLHLLKGQSTTYQVILSGLNGLPGGAWSGSSDPTDLVGSSELSAAQKAAGTSRTGFITLSVTNGSPGVIAMQNQFETYNAASFVPNGSHELDGSVTALVKGNFTINGVARAYLDPEIGIGTPPGTTPTGGSTGPSPGTLGTNWFPPFQVNYDPAAFSNSSFMTSCPGSGAPPPIAPTPTGGKPASNPCVDSVINDLMPPKSNPQNNEVKGNTPDQTKPETSELDAATKRAEEAKEKYKAALENMDAADKAVDAAFNSGLMAASEDLQMNLKDAEDKLEKARAARENAATAQETAPSKENEQNLAQAEVDETDASDAAHKAKNEVIQTFSPEVKKDYEEALENRKKAGEEWKKAFNEEREADDALEKVQQALPPPKPPLDEVM